LPTTPAGGKPYTLGAYAQEAKISLGNYYMVTSVEFDTSSIPADFYAFDDDAKIYKNLSKPVADDTDVPTARERMFALLSRTQPKFKITYNDAANTSRTIGFNEFYANVRNAIQREYQREVTIDDIFDLGGTIKTEAETQNSAITGASTLYELLWFDENEDVQARQEAWKFGMQYVPLVYGGTTHTTKFPVYLPVYQFEQELTVTRRSSTNVWLPWKSEGSPFVTFGTWDSNADKIKYPEGESVKAIQDAWTLTGRYQYKGQYKNKTLDFTANMFNYGVSGQTQVNLNGFQRGQGPWPYTISNQVGLGCLPNASDGMWDRDYTLPLLYRTVKVADEGDSVEVDLRYQKP